MTTAPIRVLIHPFFFLAERWNGMDEHLLLFARYLDRSRFEPRVLVHVSDGPQTRLLAKRAAMRAIDAPYGPGASAQERLRALRALYAAERIDLVHLQSPVAGGQAIPALAARLAGVRVTMATYHQIQPRRLSLKTRAINYLTHAALIDRTIAVSHDVRSSLIAATGLPSRRLHVVHNGIDPLEPAGGEADPPPRADRAVRIGYFGRLSPEKGVSRLIEALARLGPDVPATHTVIVGDGPERQALETQASRLGLAARVEFLGFRPDARRIMEQVDIVVHVPMYEGFGLVVLEAMAAGRPVIGSDAPGGLPEIIADGETGLLVRDGAPHALAQALARLIVDPQERRRLGQNGRARWEQRFSARAMVESIATHYEEALLLSHG